MKSAYAGFSILLAVLVNVAFAQKPAVVADKDPGWKRIGQVTASFKKQNESIAVMGHDEFSAIKLKVSEAPINIERVQVFYESGDMEELDVRSVLQKGSETAALKLSKPYRDIKKVAFTYKTLPNTEGEKADLELYGLKTDQAEHADTYIEKEGQKVDEEVEEAEREVEAEAKEVEREAEEEAEQAEREAEETEGDVERAVENTADDLSEAAAKAMAEVTDRRHHTMVGPKGQVIFITDEGKYYYIDNEGKKVFVTEAQLRKKDDK